MSLENVRDTVIEAARSKAGELAAKAGLEAERLSAEQRNAFEREAAETVRDARVRLERETVRELERLQYENRLEALAAKNAAIDGVFKRVKDLLAAMPDGEYVGMVGGWLRALPSDVGGVLRVNPRDADKFASRLGDLNKGRKGAGKFENVEADPKVHSGAVVDGPDFAVDCTVERRLDALRETAVGDLARTLFAAK